MTVDPLAERQPDWFVDAACLGADPELFFPERGESSREAKAVCAGCPVRTECLEYALSENIIHGIFGGLSIRERRRIKARRRAA